MFKFGKQLFQVVTGRQKLLDDAMVMKIAIEVGMFESWYSEKHKKMLSHDEIPKLVGKILLREDVIFTEDQRAMIETSVMVGFDQDKIKQFRVQSNFDQQIDSFCKATNCEYLL